MNLLDILTKLRESVDPRLLASKPVGRGSNRQEVDYIPWYDVCQLLDERTGGLWEWRIVDIQLNDSRIFIVGELKIFVDGQSLVRQASGTEELNCSSYGDPSSNAEAMALRRAAAKFGLGIDLWRKEGQKPSSVGKFTQQSKQTFKTNKPPIQHSRGQVQPETPRGGYAEWFEKGRRDAITKVPPKHQSVKPYMDGYNKEVSR